MITYVRMAERSKALRSGRSPLLWAWVRIPLLTAKYFLMVDCVPLAQRIARWTSNPKVPGSNPGWDIFFFRGTLHQRKD